MTTVLVVSRPANMPGYNTADLEEVQSLSSFPQASMASSAPGMFSFAQTEPPTDLLGASWVATAEGVQNFPDFPDNGASPSAEGGEEYIFTSGQSTPRGSRLDQTQTRTTGAAWTTAKAAPPTLPSRAEGMSRIDSSISTSSSLSHASEMSKSDMSGNAPTFRTGPDVTGSISGMDSCLLLDNDANNVPSQMYWHDYTIDMGLNTGSGFPLSDVSPLHVSPAQMHLGADGLPDDSSPSSWDFSSSISRTSSPATIDEAWLPAAISPSTSPSPKNQNQLSSLDRNMSVIPEEANGSGSSLPLMENTLTMTAPFTIRRQGIEGESARDHHLYKNVAPQADGLYHCPWEGDASCNHRPEKLKCNYDKFVDSHLKPYRCKADSCEGARFSSTACLLRHEREAHGLHGHGDKPFLCIHQGCERSMPGNGFPRQWNLRDHMKRVHNDHGGPAGSPPSAQAQQPSSLKGRKRKTDASEQPTSTSRKSSIKSMPTGDVKQVSARPLLDQWMDHRRVVESIIRGLQKPEDSKNLQHITEIQTRLNAMAKMTSDFCTAPAADVPQGPNHGSYNADG